MNDIPLWILFTSLVLLILASGFFSGSETGLMALNRYRLRHLAQANHRGALRAQRLLDTPDKLISLILLGNNIVNILITLLAAAIMLRLFGELNVLTSTAILTVVMVLFAEVTPKTLAALRPERFAFPATFILTPLLKLTYPFVWLVNRFTHGIFILFKIDINNKDSLHLTQDELRTVVIESGSMIPQSHQDMLLGILDLEQVTVDDIMIPRNEVIGIDLDDDWAVIIDQIHNTQHTRIPIYRGDMDHVLGTVHLRRMLKLITQQKLNQETLVEVIHEPYFVPEGTPLHTQLLNFKQRKRRTGMVVNEYGDMQGLVTLEDILEEIVGEFTTDPSDHIQEVHPQDDGTWLIDGTANIRELNKLLKWQLPTDGPKTLNGLILEQLEAIPESGTSMKIAGHPIDIVQASGNAVKTARIYPVIGQMATETTSTMPVPNDATNG